MVPGDAVPVSPPDGQACGVWLHSVRHCVIKNQAKDAKTRPSSEFLHTLILIPKLMYVGTESTLI